MNLWKDFYFYKVNLNVLSMILSVYDFDLIFDEKKNFKIKIYDRFLVNSVFNIVFVVL